MTSSALSGFCRRYSLSASKFATVVVAFAATTAGFSTLVVLFTVEKENPLAGFFGSSVTGALSVLI